MARTAFMQLMTEISKRHIPALDGMRGFAILLVLTWHYIVNTFNAEPGTLGAYVLASLRLSWSGVDLFFVLSGFLIGGILLDTRDSSHYLGSFFLRRACRILPLYFAWLVLFFVVPLIMRAHWLFDDGSLPIWTYLTFTQNFAMALGNSFGPNWLGVTWSLAVEEQFYLFLPFVLLYSKRKWIPRILIFLVVCAPLLRLLLASTAPSYTHAPYVLMPCRMDALLLGVLVAWAMRQQHIRELLRVNIELPRIVLLVSSCAAGVLILRNYMTLSFVMVTFGYSCLAILYASLLTIIILNEQGFLARLFSFRPLRLLGMIAYAIYIFHQGVHGLLHNSLLGHYKPAGASWTDASITVLSLITVTVLAAISWRIFERPIIHWGKTAVQDDDESLVPKEQVSALP